MLKAAHLKKWFGQRQVLLDVNMHIEQGQCYTIFGANGSGKTTLAFIFASLLKPTGGTLTYEQVNIHDLDTRYRASVGLLTHSSFLYENLTGLENLSFFGGLYNVRDLKQNVWALASFFKVDDRMNEPVRDLSRGLKQRLSIIRLLIHDPDIIILDEPFTGLDEIITKKLHHMLKEKQKAGKHILITTHNLSRGYESATKIGILAHGAMQFETQRDSITFDELKHTYKQLIQNETA